MILEKAVAEPPFSERLREARQNAKITQVKLAEMLGVTQSAVAQWESGRSLPSEGLAGKIEMLLGVRYRPATPIPESWPRPRRPRLPIIGLPAPGDAEHILVDGAKHGDLPAPPQLEAVSGASAVYVRGHAMEPRYFAGEVVYLNPNRKPNPGDFVFLVVKEPNYATPVGYVRRLVSQDLVHITVSTVNPREQQHFPLDQVVSIATIVGSGLL
jgi:transcriptional regulator with XRE-family HTH domain